MNRRVTGPCTCTCMTVYLLEIHVHKRSGRMYTVQETLTVRKQRKLNRRANGQQVYTCMYNCI